MYSEIFRIDSGGSMMYQNINTYLPADSNVCSIDSHVKIGFIVANIH